MAYLYPLATATFSFLLSAGILKFVKKHQILDIPNERSSHTQPTPRGGGIAIFTSFFVSSLIFYFSNSIPFLYLVMLLGGFAIALLGGIDDIRGLSVKVRFPVHIIASAFVVAVTLQLDFSIGSLLLFAFYTLFIGWMLNLYNFMDGIDSLATLQTISVALWSFFFCLQAGNDGTFFLLFASAAAGFLFWNWSPAKIFMGDVGSAFIGFSLGALAVIFHFNDILPFQVSLILNGFFIADATYTLVVRILKKQKFYQAHRSHAYQKAAILWKSHKRVSLSALSLNFFWLGPIAYWAFQKPELSIPLVALAYAPLLLIEFYFKAGVPEKA